jgi:hypothetical protein
MATPVAWGLGNRCTAHRFITGDHMKFVVMAFAAASVLSAASAQAALSAGDQYNLDQIRSGSPNGLRAAAQNIAASGSAPQEVTDVLAEAMLQNASHPGDAFVDAVAWSCKGLASAGGRRYYTAIKQVADSGNRKLEKHCKKAADGLGSANGPQYVQGGASLAAGAVSNSAAPQVAAAVSAPPAASGSFKPITEVKVGMSLQEAYAISGPPQSSNSHITGKAFIPFNFKGADSQRMIGHYKGQGRVVFSNTSAYTSGQRVLEVQIDPNETGY